MSLRDETDREMLPGIEPAYRALRERALEKMRASQSPILKVHELGWAWIGGEKMTLELRLSRTPEEVVEQFEYYRYRYFHFRVQPCRP